VASFPEGGLGRQQRPVDTAGRGKEYKVMGVGGVFGDTEVASHRRGGTGHAMKEFVDRPLQLLTSG
jgi:hypothetical protein